MKDRVNKKRTEKFTTTSNKILQDSRLSYDAIGVFMYLWSMPDDWQVMVKQVMKHNNSSEYKVRQALRELRDFGYMKWTRTQGYFIYDMCEDGTFHCVDIQHNESHYSDSQHNHIYIQNNNINKTITKTNTASGFSSSQRSCLEIPNNSNLTSSKQKDEEVQEFEEFYDAFGKKVKKVKALQSFQKALKTKNTTFQSIMDGVNKYNQYLKVATWLEKADPTSWLNQQRWEDDYDDLIKQECVKSGKTPPITQKSPEKVQEDQKAMKDIQSKLQVAKSRLTAEEKEFNEYIKEHLKTVFSGFHYELWIKDIVVFCRDGVAGVGTIRNIDEQKNKLLDAVSRELKSKGFAFNKIEWKLIN